MYTARSKKRNLALVLKTDNESRLQTLFMFYWIYGSLITSAVNFGARFLGLSDYTDLIRAVLVVAVLFYVSPAIAKFIKVRHLVFYMAVILVYGLTFVLFPENTKWLQDNFINFTFCVLPFIFLGFILSKMQIPYHTLVICSRLIIVMMILVYLFYSEIDITAHEMGRAYGVLPSLMLVTHSFLKRWNWPDFINVVIGGVFLLMCATRGPILCYLVFVLVLIFMEVEKHRKLYMLLLIAVVVLGFSPIGITLLEAVMTRFSRAGFNVRIFEYLLAGNITDDNGRDYLTEKVFELISNRPLIGNGLYSDRLATSSLPWLAGEGSYVHNIIYELWCDFGYVIGSLLIVIFVYLAMKAYRNTSKNMNLRGILLILLFSYVFKLLMSSSFLNEPGFWICLGMCYECQYGRNSLIRRAI